MYANRQWFSTHNNRSFDSFKTCLLNFIFEYIFVFVREPKGYFSEVLLSVNNNFTVVFVVQSVPPIAENNQIEVLHHTIYEL